MSAVIRLQVLDFYLVSFQVTQFFRVLWENLGIKLGEEQQQALIEKYDLKQDGRLNYRLFCDIITQPFNPNNINANPAQQNVQPMEL